MTKSLIALAFAALSGMLLVATPEVAQAQSLTITGFTCTGGWTFSANTLTCGGGSGPPSCTISGSVNGTTGAVDTLTANCNPAATSWSWTGGSCAGVTTQTCPANEGVTGQKTYTVTGTNAAGTGSASPGYNVQWYSTSGPPQGCAITPASQSLPNTGGNIGTLTVACAGGAQPLTSFTWTHSGAGCSAAGFVPSSTKNQGENLPANTTTGALTCTYNVTVDNGSGTPAVATPATASVAGTGGTITCTNTGITGETVVQQVGWADDTGIHPTGKQFGNSDMNKGDAYVGIINVPAGAPLNASSNGHIDVMEYVDTTHRRWATLSPTPCTWGQPGDGTTFTQYGTNPTFYFTIGPNSNGYVPMTPGTTYYLNIRMQDPVTQGNQCGSLACNMNIELHKPPGT